jgi:hypothetical protein
VFHQRTPNIRERTRGDTRRTGSRGRSEDVVAPPGHRLAIVKIIVNAWGVKERKVKDETARIIV